MFSQTPDHLKKKVSRQPAPDQRKGVPLHFHCALVIEEDEELRRVLVQLLKERGWLVHGMRRAEQALPILGRISYHLIIADAELPGLSGLQFARMLHRGREWGSIPVIILANTRSHRATQVGACVVRRSAWCNELTKTLAGIEADLDRKGANQEC